MNRKIFFKSLAVLIGSLLIPKIKRIDDVWDGANPDDGDFYKHTLTKLNAEVAGQSVMSAVYKKKH